jgi:hypothetical protein
MGLVGGGYGDPAWIDEQLTIAHPVDVGVRLITWAIRSPPVARTTIARQSVINWVRAARCSRRFSIPQLVQGAITLVIKPVPAPATAPATTGTQSEATWTDYFWEWSCGVSQSGTMSGGIGQRVEHPKLVATSKGSL